MSKVRERPSGLWEGQYRVGGKSRSVYGKTKREAEVRLRAAQAAADNGIKRPTGRGTVGAYLEDGSRPPWSHAVGRGRLSPTERP
jgi:hypothetical protein